ncbi:MAG: hypothetical protein OXN19_16360 [Caldilineaceae bacterium]|nr:hypothetical protein [Caldilineaceae bacterium]
MSGSNEQRATAHGLAPQMEARNLNLKRAQWKGPSAEELATSPRGRDGQVARHSIPASAPLSPSLPPRLPVPDVMFIAAIPPSTVATVLLSHHPFGIRSRG